MIREKLPSFLQASDDVMEAFILAIDNADSNVLSQISDILVHAFIDTATGEYLDRIGALADVKREGRTDDDYRSAIIAKITTPSGTVGMLNNLIKTLTDEDAYIEEVFSEDGVLHFRVHANYERFWDKTPKKAFEDAVESAKAAGTVPLWYFKLSEALKEVLNIIEQVSMPKNTLQDSETINEDVQMPKEAVDLPHAENSDTELLGESVSTELYTPPYYWDNAKWDLAEWS